MKSISTYHRALVLLFIYDIASTARCQSVQAPAVPPAIAAAPTPAPPPPLNITAILQKAGQFTTLIRLLKSTQLDERINAQLNNSNAGLTLFAPSDNAFSSLQPGTLNKLTNQQHVTLLQFHVIPTLITLSQFQTVSNPLSTQAGDSGDGHYPLNVTTAGTQVNISTGLVNTTVTGTVYSDSQLAVYQVDKVLLPLGIFRPTVPAPPAKAEKNASAPSEGPSLTTLDSAGVSSGVEWESLLAFPFAVSVSLFVMEFLNPLGSLFEVEN
ncbi:Fasciclin-like arabinogalactan protein 11 [Platanthera zijinensis]|uniref:Fasciclin-like arabinogalactan protein 11 n=1 Tax=Platanthera zijinensis TaxID=2320716 RepID=A0AAP0BVP9_9ASPA